MLLLKIFSARQKRRGDSESTCLTPLEQSNKLILYKQLLQYFFRNSFGASSSHTTLIQT
jgi:hypothetical protein